MQEIEFYLEDLKSKFQKIERSSYYLSYSGGKDSHLLYWFIKEILKDDQIEIVSVNTFMEHSEIRKRMYNNSDIILLPKKTPTQVKEEYGSPCFSKSQDEFIQRYQKGCRSYNTLKYVNRKVRSRYNLNKLASELTISESLHKVSNKCCYFLKKQPLKEYEKKTKMRKCKNEKRSKRFIY